MTIVPLSKSETDREIEAIELSSGDVDVTILNYGAVTQSLRYKGKETVLGYSDPKTYLTDPFYLGAMVGPVANRIASAAFQIDGEFFQLEPNEGDNLLHSGLHGLSKKFWHVVEKSRQDVLLRTETNDSEAGFPGNVWFELRIFIWNNTLNYQVHAGASAPTPISLAQHNYYKARLKDENTKLSMTSEHALDVDNHLIPTGALRLLRREELLGEEEIDSACVIKRGQVATLTTDAFSFDLLTNQSSLQVYSGTHLGDPFEPNTGLCLEPQGYPNAVNQPEFPNVIIQPGETYRYSKILRFH